MPVQHLSTSSFISFFSLPTSHSGRIAAPHLPEAVRLGRQLLRRRQLAVGKMLPVGVRHRVEMKIFVFEFSRKFIFAFRYKSLLSYENNKNFHENLCKNKNV
jgi:hypothetical protein